MEDVKAYYTLTKKAFDFLAPIYNVMTLSLARVRNQVVRFANAAAGSLVLDVATGTGQQAFAFAKRGYEVIGVDLIESMLEIAQKHNKDSFVKFEAGDATSLWFAANTFDVTCISFALHDMPLAVREKVLQEMMRLTKQNGTIVIVDYDLPGDKLRRNLIYRLTTLYEGEYYKHFITSDLDTLLGKVGIEIAEKQSFLFGAGRMIKGVKSNRAETGAAEPFL